MSGENFKRNYSVQLIHRAMEVLRAFTVKDRTLSLTQIHQKTDISLSSLQRLLSTMVFEGILERNPRDKRYQLGLELLTLGHLVEKNSTLIIYAKPVMEKIAELTGETITLNVVEDNQRKCIFMIESKHELTALTHVGQFSPLFAGASAKSLLAYFSDNDLDKYLNSIKLSKITNSTITEEESIRRELLKIRKHGFAFSRGEKVEGAVSLSTPIFNRFNEIMASIAIVIPEPRYISDFSERTLKLLKNGCEEVTERIKGKSLN